MSASLNKFWLKNLNSCITMFYLRFKKKNEWLVHFRSFPLFGERCEWIAHFAQIKRAMWANCSGYSPKMSYHERFAQVIQRKWAIMSELLRSLTKNEWMSESLIVLSESLIRSFLDKKRVIRSEIKWANSQPWKNSSLRIVFDSTPVWRLKCCQIQIF